MATGDPICSVCGHYSSLCRHDYEWMVRMAKLGYANQIASESLVFKPMTLLDRDKIFALIDQIESDACSCDIMYGYSCNIHAKIQALRDEFKKTGQIGVN
jgi:hypothetical protein